MFTGIVERTGRIVAIQATPDSRRLFVQTGELAGACRPGASVCVSGVCLTVVASDADREPAHARGNRPHADGVLEFDVVRETLARTTLGGKRVGDRVNLERALSATDRFDGHFVQGHIDGTAVVEEIRRTPGDARLWLRSTPDVRCFIIPKGSVAVDGVSLTIAQCTPERFAVALIPTTLARTTLSSLAVGNTVNIESDLIVRTIVHRLTQISPPASLSLATLKEAGFA